MGCQGPGVSSMCLVLSYKFPPEGAIGQVPGGWISTGVPLYIFRSSVIINRISGLGFQFLVVWVMSLVVKPKSPVVSCDLADSFVKSCWFCFVRSHPAGFPWASDYLLMWKPSLSESLEPSTSETITFQIFCSTAHNIQAPETCFLCATCPNKHRHPSDTLHSWFSPCIPSLAPLALIICSPSNKLHSS